MRKIAILILTGISLMLAACNPSAGNIIAETGKEFTLSVNQTATIRGENLKVTFLQVTEDSRCPTGAQCVWEGRATSLVRMVGNNTTDIKLSEPGLSGAQFQRIYGNYFISFHLQPYPQVGKPITDDQYRLVMSVSKQ